MKLIIDIDENVFTRLFDNGVDTSPEDRKVIDRAVRNGTPYEDRSQSEWSIVSAQEPDVGGIYLVTAKHISGHIGIDLARRISKDVWTFGGEKLPGVEIVAWNRQPLPEPYKEANSDK